MKICCFTGHRSLPMRDVVRVSSLLDRCLEELYQKGYREFRTGGARGFDTVAALRILRLREKHTDVRLSLILPCADQAAQFSRRDATLWAEIKEAADEVKVLSPTYSASCMRNRNMALVEGSDCCVAYLTQGNGGTFFTATYAIKKGLDFINLAEQLHI